jgi:hypothetical protein
MMRRSLLLLSALSIACGCRERPSWSLRGPLASAALEVRSRAANWACDTTAIVPSVKGQGPMLKCQGIQGDTQIAILSDTTGVVVAIAREAHAGREMTRDVYANWKVALTRRAGSSREWCDSGSMQNVEIWPEDSLYTLLGIDTVRGSVNQTTTLGSPECVPDHEPPSR